MSTHNTLLWTMKEQYPYLLVEKSVPSGAMHKQSILENVHLNFTTLWANSADGIFILPVNRL